MLASNVIAKCGLFVVIFRIILNDSVKYSNNIRMNGFDAIDRKILRLLQGSQ